MANGGFLVVTNSEYNYITVRPVDKHNEDARALNGLLEPMGIKFMVGGGMYDANSAIAQAVTEHPLTANATYLSFYNDNGVPFSMETGWNCSGPLACPSSGWSIRRTWRAGVGGRRPGYPAG